MLESAMQILYNLFFASGVVQFWYVQLNENLLSARETCNLAGHRFPTIVTRRGNSAGVPVSQSPPEFLSGHDGISSGLRKFLKKERSNEERIETRETLANGP